MHRLFRRHVVSSEEMTDALGRAVDRFLAQVDGEERALRRDVRMTIKGLPELGVTASLDGDAFERLIEERVGQLAVSLERSAKIDFAAELVKFAGFAGVSKAVIGSGVLDSVPKHVSDALRNSVVGWIVNRVEKYLDDLTISEDEVRSTALGVLDDLKSVLMKGGDEAWSDFECLEGIARNSENESERNEAEEIIQKMRNNGHLGLNEILGVVQERSAAIKREVYGYFGGEE